MKVQKAIRGKVQGQADRVVARAAATQWTRHQGASGLSGRDSHTPRRISLHGHVVNVKRPYRKITLYNG